MRVHDSTSVLLDGLAFAEGPRWRDDRLWFSDMGTRQVRTVTTDGTAETVVEVPGRPSGLGWLPDGRLLAVSMQDRRLVVWDGTALAMHADLSPLIDTDPNDMVVDAAGRAYVGHAGFDLRERPLAPRPASLVLVRPDGSAEVVDDEVVFPNGSVISPDGRILIVAETFGQRLTAFERGEDGSLTTRRPFADLPGRSPDGIALDVEGGVWVADAGGSCCVRVLDGGEITDRVDVGRGCFACALGGDDGRTLFLLTGEGYTGEAIRRRTGAIETVRVDVPGAGSP